MSEKLLQVKRLEEGRGQKALSPFWLYVIEGTENYWISVFDKRRTPARLRRSLGVTGNKQRAIFEGEKVYSRWLGQDLHTGILRRAKWSEVSDEKLSQMESQLIADKLAEGTLGQARIYLRKLREEFGPLVFDPNEKDPSARFVTAWRKFVSDFQKAYPKKTLENQWKYFSIVMNHAHSQGLIHKPWEEPNPDPKKPPQRILTAAEVGAIYEAAPPNLKDQMLFASTMGMRKMEHFRLSWKTDMCCHVNLEARLVVVCQAHSKTRKARTIHMSPQVYYMLVRRKAGYYKHGRGRSDLWVFPARGDMNNFVRSNKKAWGTAKKLAGIQGKCKYHLLRHYFLTECAKLVKHNTISMVLVCNYAGVSIKTFEKTYLHLDHKDTAAVSNLVAMKLAGSTFQQEVMH